jgi:hypothetical protein
MKRIKITAEDHDPLGRPDREKGDGMLAQENSISRTALSVDVAART